MPHPVIFLDDGGVMNDNIRRGLRWQELVGEFFAPLLGGPPEAWQKANLLTSEELFEPANWQRRLQATSDYASFDRLFLHDWLKNMCRFVGITAPATEDCIALAERATRAILPRAHAAFPGAIEAIRTLFQQGYTLYTASGESSRDLAGYLQGMGVRDCFAPRLYGPDLINTFKDGPEYYRRIFSEVGIAPARAIVVDDTPLVIPWACQAGARTVLVRKASSEVSTDATWQIASLAELPALLAQLN
ncbi:hypothetical protein EPA93_36870 [Ktedonosporobacter rubrisoli]|uniref:HAD family hydrolase n=1 Tax=Ktedonosporobacter rubrisoli TaxID=2509675 RepID=A0A4P6JZS0_KTERU|nr:HAD-IA family hydrolase [Ktedonosporobacter rubrisoli]QBD81254.1 hypothetical protein EPA93_36870 [Ktedonosporobacter rubrisoli]